MTSRDKLLKLVRSLNVEVVKMLTPPARLSHREAIQKFLLKLHPTFKDRIEEYLDDTELATGVGSSVPGYTFEKYCRAAKTVAKQYSLRQENFENQLAAVIPAEVELPGRADSVPAGSSHTIHVSEHKRRKFEVIEILKFIFHASSGRIRVPAAELDAQRPSRRSSGYQKFLCQYKLPGRDKGWVRKKATWSSRMVIESPASACKSNKHWALFPLTRIFDGRDNPESGPGQTAGFPAAAKEQIRRHELLTRFLLKIPPRSIIARALTSAVGIAWWMVGYGSGSWVLTDCPGYRLAYFPPDATLELRAIPQNRRWSSGQSHRTDVAPGNPTE
ncbi:hypothetical protein C8R47DRAFT_1079877 [Mycena vitilis]|nr:hypothetical protein C8R47DRAFT_1079877 [Mycena vitilis]